MVYCKSLKPSSLFFLFILLKSSVGWFSIACLWAHIYFILLDVAWFWIIPMNFSFKVYSSVLWILFSVSHISDYFFYIFLCWKFQYVLSLYFWLQLVSLWLFRSWLGKSHMLIALRSVYGDFIYSFIWKIFLFFFISFDSLCWFLHVR
jgi:hypothetical protein